MLQNKIKSYKPRDKKEIKMELPWLNQHLFPWSSEASLVETRVPRPHLDVGQGSCLHSLYVKSKSDHWYYKFVRLVCIVFLYTRHLNPC